jgi:uncharacterized protein (TIGR02246 family)
MESTRDDERELRDLSLRYARACDTHDGAELARIFTDDAVIEAPPHVMTGRDQIVAVIPSLLSQMYLRTMHLVHNDLAWIDGDEARGETYCLAHHLTPAGDGKATDFIMAIVYANRFRRTDGVWRFSHRRLNVGWTQTVSVDLPG